VNTVLQQGRTAYRRRAWATAHRCLSRADQKQSLAAGDLELLAASAYLVGEDESSLVAIERSHHAWLDAGELARAVRAAFWLGLHLLLRGETGPATGWLARGKRLLKRTAHDCVERGYLLVPLAEQQLASEHCNVAHATAERAVEIGERFRDTDLIACARHIQGRARLSQGHRDEGLALLDEAMVAVTAGEVSPIMSGLVYCSVIDACQQVYAVDRVRDWTNELSRWCAGQPEMIAFSGVCRVHRAAIMQLRGAWADAVEEARHALERSLDGNRAVAAAALYEQAEVYRLRGEFAAAEEAYRDTSRLGREPQPGLALLRLAQRRTGAAAAAIRRVLAEAKQPLVRAKLLPAYVEIMLAVGDTAEAERGCTELDVTAAGFDAATLHALALHARGSVQLAVGDAGAALASLRAAGDVWQQMGAPYLAARVRVLAALACRALADDDGARLELDAARATFTALGAAPDLAHIETLARKPAARADRLTPRELQVLRLVSTGKTNRTIAAELALSAKTVDRHLSNILDKLDVPSRAAATAYAYRHDLI
jgi:DNA-binding CsgD family transcriptional regulator